jgi:hypothetical protein
MRYLLFYCMLAMCFNLNARTEPREVSKKIQGSAAAYSTFDSTAMSMMLWGTGLAVVITTAAILIPKSSSGSNSHAD